MLICAVSFSILFSNENAPDAPRIFLLPNANETQRSSATLSGMSGRQKEKGASSGRRQMQKIVFGNSFGDAGSEGFLHTALCYKKSGQK